MAICDLCGREMLGDEGCATHRWVDHHGNIFQPIVFCGMGDMYEDDPNLQRCPDCGTPRHQPHHPGCDVERCPYCGNQLIMCQHMHQAVLLEDIDVERKA